MTICYVSLGGNLGDVAGTFSNALTLLNADPRSRVDQCSRLFRTAPVGTAAGSEFLNAAAKIVTDYSPLELLDVLQQVENRLGRRRETHWGPRTLDLDIIFFGDQQIDEPRLRVPHPAAWYRRFVLDPLADIAGEVMHSEKQSTVQELRDRLLRPPFVLALAGGTAALRRQQLAELALVRPELEFIDWEQGEHAAEATLIAWLGAGSTAFESLPLSARLDAALESAGSTSEFLTHVLAAAAPVTEIKPLDSAWYSTKL